MEIWTRGRLLETSETKKWFHVRQQAANAQEKMFIYTNFTEADNGISRVLVAHVNRDHPNYLQNITYILEAKENYNRVNFYRNMFTQEKAKTIIANRVLKIWRTMFMLLALLITFILTLIT